MDRAPERARTHADVIRSTVFICWSVQTSVGYTRIGQEASVPGGRGSSLVVLYDVIFEHTISVGRIKHGVCLFREVRQSPKLIGVFAGLVSFSVGRETGKENHTGLFVVSLETRETSRTLRRIKLRNFGRSAIVRARKRLQIESRAGQVSAVRRRGKKL